MVGMAGWKNGGRKCTRKEGKRRSRDCGLQEGIKSSTAGVEGGRMEGSTDRERRGLR